jgi:hypothetical protein
LQTIVLTQGQQRLYRDKGLLDKVPLASSKSDA